MPEAPNVLGLLVLLKQIRDSWFCYVLATDPKYQRKGAASEIIKTVHTKVRSSTHMNGSVLSNSVYLRPHPLGGVWRCAACRRIMWANPFYTTSSPFSHNVISRRASIES